MTREETSQVLPKKRYQWSIVFKILHDNLVLIRLKNSIDDQGTSGVHNGFGEYRSPKIIVSISCNSRTSCLKEYKYGMIAGKLAREMNWSSPQIVLYTCSLGEILNQCFQKVR